MKYYFFTDFEKEWLSKPAKKAAIQLVQTWLASYLKWLSITLQMVSEWSSWPAITLHVMYKGMTTFLSKILAFIHLDQLIFSQISRFQNWQFTSRKGKCKNLQCSVDCLGYYQKLYFRNNVYSLCMWTHTTIDYYFA